MNRGISLLYRHRSGVKIENVPMDSSYSLRFCGFIAQTICFLMILFSLSECFQQAVGVLVFYDAAVSEALLFVSPTLGSILCLEVPMS